MREVLRVIDQVDSGQDHDRSTVTLDPGEVLITEGKSDDSVYVLVGGSLSVTRTINDDTVMLARLDDPGTVIGEMVALGSGLRSATVTAEQPTELVGFSAQGFQDLLAVHPDLGEELVALAIRRAEEGELTELLADHFGIVDDELLMATCGTVEWLRLSQGEALLQEGDDTDAVYFVVRGRLKATRYDPHEQKVVELGEAGRGDVVGEMGLLGAAPRNATLTAVRDSVLAKLGLSAFVELVERQPRLMMEVAARAMARAEHNRQHTTPSRVLGLVVCQRLDAGEMVGGLIRELESFGSVNVFTSDRVDELLETPGISDVSRGEVGNIRVSRLLHETEIESDHLLVDLGSTSGPWARRALGMADRLLVVVPSDLTESEAVQIERVVTAGSSEVQRTVVVVHRPEEGPPTDSPSLRVRLGGADLLHITEGSPDDLSRLARVASGRGHALVLGGGGGRGFAHMGVYRALGELGIPIDIVGGTSIGGILASAIADGWSPDEVIEWTSKNLPKVIDLTIPVVALAKGGRVARAMSEIFGNRHIEDLRLSYYCLSTNLTAARTHVHRTGPLVEAIRATSAIPGVMPPVPFGDSLLVDGGVLNNLPIDVARELAPAGKVVAVDVAPPRGPGAHGDYGLTVSGWDALRASAGSKRRYPKITAILMRSMISASMRERDNQVTDKLADCYLDLDMRGISMLDFDDPAAVASRGYDAAMPVLEKWWETVAAESPT